MVILTDNYYNYIYSRDRNIFNGKIDADHLLNIIIETIESPDYTNPNKAYPDQTERIKKFDEFITSYLRVITEDSYILGCECEKVVTAHPLRKYIETTIEPNKETEIEEAT